MNTDKRKHDNISVPSALGDFVKHAYRSFAAEHKGLFEAMQWYNMYQSEEHLQATQGMVSVFFRVLDAYELSERQKVHIVRMFRGFLQGFSSIESHGGYGNPVPINNSFDFAMKTILKGIHDLQGERQHITVIQKPSFKQQE